MPSALSSDVNASATKLKPAMWNYFPLYQLAALLLTVARVYSCSSAFLTFTLRVLESTYCSSKALEDMSTCWSATVCTAMVFFPCFRAGHIYGRQVLCLQRIGAAHFGVRLGMGRVSASVWQGSNLRHSCD